MENGIKIYSASAGSGKTFSLVVNYVDMLLKNPLAYKTTLAVTFTNASTREMKDRIIDVLNYISSKERDGEFEGYYTELRNRNKDLDEDLLRERVYIALQYIIHNYSFFNISTIDSFFQTVLRNMAKELGISTNFNIILDDSEYNKQAVRNVIATSKENENTSLLNDWLFHFFEKRIEEDEKWNFEKDLVDTANSLKNTIVINSMNNPLLSLENLEKVRLQIKEKKFLQRNTEKELKKEFSDICNKYSLCKEDFYRWTSSIYAKMQKNGEEFFVEDLLDKVVENINNGGKVLKTIETPIELVKFIFKADKTIKQVSQEYKNAKLFDSCIFLVGVLKYLYDERNDLLKQDEAFLLSNTKHTLEKMNMNSNDISFIYEKIGTYIENIMIDEFQDTSHSDWNNLKVLIDECLSKGGQSYIYGDIKQSIYRWNDGDWRIMDNECKKKSNKVLPLKSNYRTFGNIVDFNNNFFKEIYGEENAKQEIKKQAGEGSVRIKMFPYSSNVKKEVKIEKVDMLDEVKKEIDFYRSLGYKNENIVILCRGNEEISQIANYLKQLDRENNDVSSFYNPISDVAFLLSSSSSIRKLIAGMKYLNDKNAKISKEYLNTDYKDFSVDIDKLRTESLFNLSLIELSIKLSHILEIEQDTAFLPAFYDNVKSFMLKKSGRLSDFIDYWEENLCKKSVESNMQNYNNSIRLTTIHKSKGLEFDIVIIPHCNWPISKETSSIWVDNKENKFLELPLIHQTLTHIKDTCFSAEYEQEIELQKKDNLNLLYVAFTRPKKHLSLLCNLLIDKDFKPKIPSNYITDYIYPFLKRETETEQEPFVYLYKNKESIKYDTKEVEADNVGITVNDISFGENALKFSETSLAKDYFFAEEEKIEDKTVLGTKLHNVMSNIYSVEDIEKIDKNIKYLQEDKEKIIQILHSMLSFVENKHWFDNTYKVMNERGIIFSDKDNNICERRPDRIMHNEKETIVVDYKFITTEVKEDRINTYKKQVREYVELLQKIGYKNVSSFLWFINIGKENIEQEILEVK